LIPFSLHFLDSALIQEHIIEDNSEQSNIPKIKDIPIDVYCKNVYTLASCDRTWANYCHCLPTLSTV